MKNSEVFDNFVKIAQEKGLISEGEAEHTEQNTKSPRWDSLDLSAIEALYGVKPNLPKDMEYEHNIMEDAHPNSVVISPSYDPLNGLVENEMEAQNIKMHIIFKEPEMGNPNQARYPLKPKMIYPNVLGNKAASKDLLLSLVRVANDMDNKQQDSLRILADKCLDQVDQDLKKKVAWSLGPLGNPWVLGVASLLGIIYANQHLADVDQGIKLDYSRLMTELEDFRNADVTMGFGHKYDDTLKNDVASLESKLNEFWSVYSSTVPLIQNIEKPKDAKEAAAMAQEAQNQSVMQAYENLRTITEKELYPYLDKVEQNFSNPDYKAEHTVDKGAVTSLLDSVPFLHGGKTSLTADDFDDVINAISPFRAAIGRLMDVFAKAKDFKDKIATDLAASQAKTKTEEGPDPFKAAPPAPKTKQDIDEEAGGLSKELEGFMGKIPGFGN
jgi:hypothetical protein